MVNLKCIKIIHPLEEVRGYRILSSFFRFVGIFVCENIKDKEYGDETEFTYEVSDKQENLYKIQDTFFQQKETEKKVIVNILNKMKEKGIITKAYNILKNIADIFIDYNLMRGSYAIGYFGDAGDKHIYQNMSDAHKRFLDALKKLEETEDNYKKMKVTEQSIDGIAYVLTAKLNCMRRSNEIHTILWNAIKCGQYSDEPDKEKQLETELYEWPYFNIEEVNKDFEEILKDDPGFYGAYAARGFIMELDDNYYIDSVEYLKKTKELIGESSIASYILYRIGHYYEKISPDKKKKIEFYEKAWKTNPNNYRAIYKLAIDFQEQGNYRKAIEMLEKILNNLELKKDLPALQPVECAYLYKTYHSLGNIFIKLKDYDNGFSYLEKAVNIYNNTKNQNKENGFYPWMFGMAGDTKTKSEKEWKIYKQAAKNKLKVKNLFNDLMSVSALTDSVTEYNYYYNKMLQTGAGQ